MDSIKIKLSGDAKDLKPILDGLEEMGRLDKKNADQYKKTAEILANGLETAADKSKFASGEMDKLGKAVKGAFAANLVTSFKDEIVKSAENIKAAENNTKSLKTQIKEAKAEAQKLAAQFGENSKEAVKAQKAVAGLTEELDDFNQRIKALNPEAKFNVLVDVTQKVASGFQLMTGAMGVFGAESKDVEKALLRVQSATAMAQGLNELKGIGDTFKNLKVVVIDAGLQLLTYIGFVEGATVAQNILNVSTTVFKALISPLGLIITGLTVGLGFFAKAMWDSNKATEAAVAATARYNKIKAEQLKVEIEAQNKIRQLRIDNMKDGIEKDIANQRLKTQLAIEAAKKEQMSEKAKNTTIALLTENGLKEIQDIKDRYAKEAADKQKAANDKMIAEHNAALKQMRSDIKADNKEQIELEQKANDALANINKSNADKQKEDADKAAKDLIESEKKKSDAKIEFISKDSQADVDAAKKTEEDKKQLRAQEQQAALQAANQIATEIYGFQREQIEQNTRLQLNNIEKAREKELSNKKLTEKQKAEINKKYDEEALNAKRKAFEEDKRLAKSELALRTALAIMSVFAVPDPTFGILAGIRVGAILTTAAIQNAAIDNQKFELGGKVKGKRHSQGGVNIEVEGDEFIVNRKQTAENEKLLEAVNAGKGKQFIAKNYILPAVIDAKMSAKREASFAQNIANSLKYNGNDYDDYKLRKTIEATQRNSTGAIVKELRKSALTKKRNW